MIDQTFSLYQHNQPGWEQFPLGRICSEVKKPNYGSVENNLLSLSYGEIVTKNIESASGLVPESYETYNIVEPGDVVLRLTDLQNDKKSLRVGLVEERGIITSAYTTIRSNIVSAKWLYYCLHAYDLEKYFYSMGSGLRQSMKFDDLKDLAIAVPDLKTQERITTYLDNQVARAKSLSELISNLNEASHSAFRALVDDEMLKFGNPHKIKYVCKVQSGNSLSSEFIEENDLLLADGLPFIATKDIDYLGNVTEELEIHIPAELQSEFRITHPGDVLICSEGGSAGRKFAIVNQQANYGNKLFACRVDHRLMPSFLFFFFYSQLFRNQFNQSLNGLISGISKEAYGDITIPLPSITEQENFLTQMSSKFDRYKRLSNELSEFKAKFNELVRVLIVNSMTGSFTELGLGKG